MAYLGLSTPGATHRLFAYNAAGDVWNGTAYVPWSDAAYGTYKAAVVVTEKGKGAYHATLPTGWNRWELVADVATAGLHYDAIRWTNDPVTTTNPYLVVNSINVIESGTG